MVCWQSHCPAFGRSVVNMPDPSGVSLVQEFGPVSNFPEIAADKLLRLVEKWLRAEQARQRQQRKADAEAGRKGGRRDDLPVWNNGWAAGRLTSSLKLSSNAVMRM